MKRALLLAVCTAALATSAHATEDFCVIVQKTPDGFLALREGPGTRFRMKARLKPGELLIADTRRSDEKGEWTFINNVPRLDDGKKEHFTQGWVATKFTTQARCPGEAAAKAPQEFIVTGDKIINSRVHQEFVRLSERIPISQLKRRFARYKITSTAGEDSIGTPNIVRAPARSAKAATLGSPSRYGGIARISSICVARLVLMASA